MPLAGGEAHASAATACLHPTRPATGALTGVPCTGGKGEGGWAQGGGRACAQRVAGGAAGDGSGVPEAGCCSGWHGHMMRRSQAAGARPAAGRRAGAQAAGSKGQLQARQAGSGSVATLLTGASSAGGGGNNHSDGCAGAGRSHSAGGGRCGRHGAHCGSAGLGSGGHAARLGTRGCGAAGWASRRAALALSHTPVGVLGHCVRGCEEGP